MNIGLLRVSEPWEVFAQLDWGVGNDSPLPAEQCALHRYWASQHGAEVVSVTSDIVQCVVAHPPAEREACLKLAREQFLYCGDIVHQGCGTIGRLAAGLQNARHWYFWWD